MLEVMWKAMRPEKEIDYIRAKMAAAFSDDFGTEWREDTICYDVVDDQHFVGDVYDPIVKAKISFVAVCKMDLADAEAYIYWYERYLQKLGIDIDNVFITFKKESDDWSKWRPAVW